MLKLLVLVLFTAFQASAQNLPEHLEERLISSQEYFQTYAQKSSAQINDADFDESEYLLFAQIDQINSFDIIFSKEEIKDFKRRMVISLSQSFDSSQLQAIVSIAKSRELNKKKSARYFEVAQEYQKGNVLEIRIPQQLRLN